MRTKTWFCVSKCGKYTRAVPTVAWTDTTITTTDTCCFLQGKFFATVPIRSSDGDNYFDTAEEAIAYSTMVVAGNIAAQERLVWA